MNKSKILIAILFGIVIGLVAGWALGQFSSSDHAHSNAGETEQLYTCGMHPQVIQNKPGNCPICEMKLTPIRRKPGGGAQAEAATQSSVITIDPVTIQNMGIRTSKLARGPLRHTVRTVGVIDYDETALADVTTKFDGWIEKLYVDATGKQVHRGDPLFEIYSPDLYSAQVEYILALEQGAKLQGANGSFENMALTKLQFFDISSEQISQLGATRKPKKTLQVGAPIDGFVVEKMAVEGMMLNAGMKLYRIANLGNVWIYAEIYEQDLPYIQLGQEATVSLSYWADRKFRGRVTYIYPTVDEKTRTARVRMEFHNPGYLLKPGMFASVTVASEIAASALLVPDSAVLRSGEKNTVFVALEGGKFEPRTVTLGARAEEDFYQVHTGLNAGERVVTSGQFMLDSESQLREAVQKMRNPSAPGSSAGEPHMHTATPTTEADPIQAEQEPPVYICPMPEHVTITYAQSGECSLCGMTLVPVAAELLAHIQPGGQIEGYTCPMPQHSDVRSDKPGKCSKCGMTLIPIMPKPEPLAAETMELTAAPVPSPLYTCPMASHADVVSDKPGKCVKCEMKLVESGTVAHGKLSEEHWRKQHSSAPASENHQH